MAGYFLFVCFRLQKCCFLRLQSFLHLLYFAYFCRENTEGTPTQLPANKKCCLLIFAISIGCLVLADIPASSLQFPSGHSSISGTAVPFGCLVLAVPPARILATASCLFIVPNIFGSSSFSPPFPFWSSVPFRSLWYIWYCRPIWLSCARGYPRE